MSEVTADEIALHLKRCGFVDPDDDTVPIFTGNDPHFAWTSADTLAEALLAQFEISPRVRSAARTDRAQQSAPPTRR